MLRPHKRLLAWCLLVTLTIVLGTTRATAQKQPASHEPSSVAWQAPAEGQADQYVGGEVCAGCHADQARQFAKTIHANVSVAGVTYGTGCESCHGPGKPHADAQMEGRLEEGKKLIFSFQGKPDENAAHCMACHESSKDQDSFGRSEHKLQGLSCNQCHAAHLLERTSGRERVELSIAQAQFFSAPKAFP